MSLPLTEAQIYVLSKNKWVIYEQLKRFGYESATPFDIFVREDHSNYYVFFRDFLVYECSKAFMRIQIKLDREQFETVKIVPEKKHDDNLIPLEKMQFEDLLQEFAL